MDQSSDEGFEEPFEEGIGVTIDEPFEEAIGVTIDEPFEEGIGVTIEEPFEEGIRVTIEEPFEEGIGVRIEYRIREGIEERIGEPIREGIREPIDGGNAPPPGPPAKKTKKTCPFWPEKADYTYEGGRGIKESRIRGVEWRKERTGLKKVYDEQTEEAAARA